jgi:hypothetical protein
MYGPDSLKAKADPNKYDQHLWAVHKLLNHPYISPRRAPPGFERDINIQEIETILCKWKSYMKGHYQIGEDIEACRVALSFKDYAIADQLLRAGKAAKLW